jgi:hypothetical protein
LVISPDWDEWASSTITAKGVPRQPAHLLADVGELLERGDDDVLLLLQRLLQFLSAVRVRHHAQRLLERPDRPVELSVQHPPVGDDDDGVEDAAVVGVVERRELVGQPGDGMFLPLPALCWTT